MDKLFFLIRSALRDSRKNRSKLIMFMSSIVLGIAAIVSINSFKSNLLLDIDSQANNLLGADAMIDANRPIDAKYLDQFQALPGKNASELELLSMVYIPKTDQSVISNIKAIDGDFPFFGKINSIPEGTDKSFREGNLALVDQGLLLQEQLNIGDSIKIGKLMYAIHGELLNAFGSGNISSSFAPAIYINQDQLSETGLVTEGSLVDYSYYKKVDGDFDIESWRKENEDAFEEDNIDIETVESRKERLSDAFENVASFLNLIALISLLLGCIGVASSVQIYIKAKRQSIAIYRCLGMSSSSSFAMYLIQILFWGMIAIALGVLLGSFIQFLLPIVLKEFLPLEVSSHISTAAIVEGFVVGLVMTLLFSLLPLLSIRKITPMQILRSSNMQFKSRDALNWLVSALIPLSISVFLYTLVQDWKFAGIFTAGLMIAYGVLLLVAKLMMWTTKRFFPKGLSYVLRQGISNLYRPNNQTQTLIVSLGLGTAILSTLFIIQSLLLANVQSMDAGNQPNLILYGINSEQGDSIADFTKQMKLPVIQQVPIVTVKLESWKGRSKAQWLQDSTANVEKWAVNRETRVSYRDTLMNTEQLLEGSMKAYNVNTSDSIYVSLAERYANALDVSLGDELIWNIQGIRMKTYVGSIRKIQFNDMNARFFIIFPTGVLEEAPQFQLLISKSPDKATTAKYRSSIVKSFPNVSVVDLSSILVSLNDILSKIAYVIQFMAGFSLLTGFIVLLSSLLLSKFQRVKESVLLRTIGASSSKIYRIFAIEYAFLGGLSAITGVFLAVVASYLITTQELGLNFDINWLHLVWIIIATILITVGIGIFNSIEIVRKSPLEILRNELA